jgi:hypothetical protein
LPAAPSYAVTGIAAAPKAATKAALHNKRLMAFSGVDAAMKT